METGVTRRALVRAALTGVVLLSASSALATPTLTSLPSNAVEWRVSATDLRSQDSLAMPTPGTWFMFRTETVHPAPGLVGVRGWSASGDRLYLFADDTQILSGDIYATGAHYRLGQSAGHYYWLSQNNFPEAHAPPLGLFDATASDKGSNSPPPVRKAAADASGKYVVDLLILYTPLYQERVGSDFSVPKEAQKLAFVANSFFVNSQIPVEYRVAGVSLYAGTSERDDFVTNRDTMAQDSTVRSLRDNAGADLVVLLRTHDFDAGECGLSVLFNNADQSDPPADVDAERDAFVVIGAAPTADGAACLDVDHTFAHEVGHAMGGGHEYAPLPGVHTAPPYGLKFPVYGW